LVNDRAFLYNIKSLSNTSEFVLSICTGSALLAKAGVLKNIKATSNKLSWDWVISQDADVKWIKKARWVVDGKFYTSSGITAGIDMTLGFVADKFTYETAKKISTSLEYIWNEDKDFDPFA
jgi:transcriptional regulator GlxA family with amidase domain